jgi:hypothetical protein
VRYLIVLAFLVLPSKVQAGWCEKETAYNEKWFAENPQYPDRYEYYKKRILEGCKPNGFYSQLELAEQQVKAICAIHPDKTGCSR